MSAFSIVLILLFISALPILLVYIWFRICSFPMQFLWFFLAILCGAFSLVFALLLQFPVQSLLSFMPDGALPDTGGFAIALLKNFIRVPLTEETGRLIALILFFRLAVRAGLDPERLNSAFCTASGLLAGLSFAMFEGVSYGAADAGVAFIRTVSASPLHGACGAHIGLAAMPAGNNTHNTVSLFISAVMVHGMYNYLLINPIISPVFAIILAFLFLVSPVARIGREWRGNPAP
jgi:RsiW-degrading membrane proteinase PrsW (M82 family)